MNEKTRRSIQEIEEVIHKRTSVSSTRFRQKNKNESRCMRLCNGRCIIDGVQRWKMETSGVSLKISK